MCLQSVIAQSRIQILLVLICLGQTESSSGQSLDDVNDCNGEQTIVDHQEKCDYVTTPFVYLDIGLRLYILRAFPVFSQNHYALNISELSNIHTSLDSNSDNDASQVCLSSTWGEALPTGVPVPTGPSYPRSGG